MFEDLHKIIDELNILNEQNYRIIKDCFGYIKKNNIQNESSIEPLLDGLLDIIYTFRNDKVILLYMQICLYYYNINPENAEDYYQFYLEKLDEYNKTKML